MFGLSKFYPDRNDNFADCQTKLYTQRSITTFERGGDLYRSLPAIIWGIALNGLKRSIKVSPISSPYKNQ